MFIRRTTIKSRASGEPYYSYRLAESVRSGAGVRQHTVLNLGRNFEVPRAQWAPLAQRIEALLGGQLDLRDRNPRGTEARVLLPHRGE